MLIHCVHASQTPGRMFCACDWMFGRVNAGAGIFGGAHLRQVDHLGWPVLTGRYAGSFPSNLCCGVFFRREVCLNDGGKAPNAS